MKQISLSDTIFKDTFSDKSFRNTIIHVKYGDKKVQIYWDYDKFAGDMLIVYSKEDCKILAKHHITRGPFGQITMLEEVFPVFLYMSIYFKYIMNKNFKRR